MADKLIKHQFMRKIIYQRLNWEYNITDCTNNDIDQLINLFFKMLGERDYEKEFFKEEPISLESFKNMVNVFVDYMKDEGIVDKDAKNSDIDKEYVENLVESLLYAERMYLYCTFIAGNRNIMGMTKMPSTIRKAFATLGYMTMTDLALIYSNTNDPKSLPGIGPDKYGKFQKYMALDCDEFEVYDKYNKYNKISEE